MVAPALLANIGLGMQAAGLVSSVFGARRSARAEQEAARQNAQIAANNAQFAEWQAQSAIARGQKDVAAVQLRTRRTQGRQRALLAARGIRADEGSALDLLTDTAYFGEIDANTVADRSAMEAWALRTEGQQAAAQGQMMRARADAMSPNMTAFSTLLTGAAPVAARWLETRDRFPR